MERDDAGFRDISMLAWAVPRFPDLCPVRT